MIEIIKAAQAIKDLNNINELKNVDFYVQSFNKEILTLAANDDLSLKVIDFCSRFYPIQNIQEYDCRITFDVVLDEVEVSDITAEEVGKFILSQI